MTLHYQDDMVTLLLGNAGDVLRELNPCSVQTVVTSPPFFGLRDYGVDGQIGDEPNLQSYVNRLVDVFDALWPALADDGTVWLNLGDSYSGGGAGGGGKHGSIGQQVEMNRRNSAQHYRDLGVGPKQLLGVPWRVVFALQAAGWILRRDIVWEKPNAMPESVTDRPTTSHEYLFLLSKKEQYYYDAAAIAEPTATPDRVSGSTWTERRAKGAPRRHGIRGASAARDSDFAAREAGRNRRSVWSVPTVPFREAHFAVYPPELIRPCILAGSRPGDVVLDPFSGSGTTGMVATQEGRRYIGVDLNPEYLDLSLRTRFAQPALNFGGGVA